MPEIAAPEALSLYELADRLNIPVEWVKKQAKAGKLPHLRAGRVMLFNPVAVTAALAEMASHYPEPIEKREVANAAR